MIEWTLPLLNRIRGGLPIFFGREVTKGIPTLAMAFIIASPFWGQWWLFSMVIAFAFLGLAMGHGQWFPGRDLNATLSDPDKDPFYEFFVFLYPIIGYQPARFICMSMTGVVTMTGYVLAFIWLGDITTAIIGLLIGFSKGIAYELGHRTPLNIKHFRQGIEVSEIWWGIFLIGAV